MGKIILIIGALLAVLSKAPGQIRLAVTDIEIAKSVKDIYWAHNDLAHIYTTKKPRIMMYVDMYNDGPGYHSFSGGVAMSFFTISYTYKGEEFVIPATNILQKGYKIPPGEKYSVKLLFYLHYKDISDHPLNQSGYGKMLLEILPTIVIKYGENRGFFISKYVEFAKADLSDWKLISIKKVDTSDVEFYDEDKNVHTILSREQIAKRNIEFYRGPLNKIQPYQLKYDDISIGKIKTK